MRCTTANNIVYDDDCVAALARNGYTLDMSDDEAVFVNGNWPNVSLPKMDEAAVLYAFEQRFKHDAVMDHAAPVLLYMCNGDMVAWLDTERLCGFVK